MVLPNAIGRRGFEPSSSQPKIRTFRMFWLQWYFFQHFPTVDPLKRNGLIRLDSGSETKNQLCKQKDYFYRNIPFRANGPSMACVSYRSSEE